MLAKQLKMKRKNKGVDFSAWAWGAGLLRNLLTCKGVKYMEEKERELVKEQLEQVKYD